MATETYLDRIQNDVRRALKIAQAKDINGKQKALLARAYGDSRKALGTTRRILEYGKPAKHKQKTLRSFGSFHPWARHVPKQRRSKR